ncbi:hypothetical protein VSR82_32810 [Burkholderia sp. JPY481]
MKVRDLLHCLQDADPDAVVLYLAPYADVSAAEEVTHVLIARDVWTCERHTSADGIFSSVYHPAEYGLSLGWNPQTDKQYPRWVVILSSEPLQAIDCHANE